MKKKLFTFVILMIVILTFAENVGALIYIDNQKEVNPMRRIHFINVGNGDAILIENDGHFAMVDVGEDTNSPDGSDPRYPLRPGITINEGYEEKVINYLKKVGVQKLDFVIGTHAHSDHIGSMPNILDAFPVEKLYAKVYDDKYISDESRLWDNQYVYDRMIESAHKNKVPLVHEFDEQNTKFDFYGMYMEILNWEDKLDNNGTKKLIADENEEALGLKITYGNQKIFLASDIQNTNGDEDRLSPVIGKVDLLKIGHHGVGNESSKNFLSALSPRQVINSGVFSSFSPCKLQALGDIGAVVYMTDSFEEAIVAEVSDTEIKIVNSEQLQYNAPEGAWYYYENGVKVKNAFKSIHFHFSFEKYYFLEDGKAQKGFFEVNNNKYYADNNCVIRRGWIFVDGLWYYTNDSTAIMQIGLITIGSDQYYLDDNGVMQTGFKEIDNKKYYFDLSSGAMKKGIYEIEGKNYYFDKDTGEMKTGIIEFNGSKYYLDNETSTLQSGFIKIDNNIYYFSPEDFSMQIGWISINDKTYYAGNDGVLKLGMNIIDGKIYHFDSVTGELKPGIRL